jgi:glucose-6-phosphate isomerase
MLTSCPAQGSCFEQLLELNAPSRLGRKDATLFSACTDDVQSAELLLGWVSLCTDPPLPISEIIAQAESIRGEGLDAVVLIGQGGSSQAAMTITKLNELYNKGGIAFRTMDSLSPVFVNHILGSSDPARTIYIVASKSGSTIEPLMLERVAWQYVTAHLGQEAAARRFVALTDPGSGLERMAKDRGYRAVLPTPANVGGRFSALTAFGLFPAALVGLDVGRVIEAGRATERACSEDASGNPALRLACFLYDAYCQGRDKFSLVMPSSGQVFGLWVEQLVAESLGKRGIGILPNVEVDASILVVPRNDRSAITYAVGNCQGFLESIAHIDASIPKLDFAIDNPYQIFSHFITWEYAIAFLGLLLRVFPFDQPDVEVTKKLVKQLLLEKSADGSAAYHSFGFDSGLIRSMHVSKAVIGQPIDDVDQCLRTLFGCLAKTDFFSLNAFLPFRGYGRREALERMRNRIASRMGVVSCLEIGPRYLHSTGQLHKGGPNSGVFLIISADEDNDIMIPGEGFSLGTLAATQAEGDFMALAARGRRVVHFHLTGNDSETLSQFADRVCSAISANIRPL